MEDGGQKHALKENRQLRVALCDDERTVWRDFAALWQKNFAAFQYRLDFFDCGEALLTATAETSFDCIYLDIRLPELDGVETARRLRASGCDAPVIFLTNYDDYLEVGYEVRAFRYRFKPLQEELFLQDIRDWRALRREEHLLIVPTDRGVRQIRASELIYAEVAGRGTRLVTTGETLLSTAPMRHWETTLPTGMFLSPYSKILVNAAHVKFFDQQLLITTGDHRLPVSRRKYPQFKAAMLRL